jgi:hypothetical protein
MLASFLISQGAGKLGNMLMGAAKEKAVEAIAEKLGVEPKEESIEHHLSAHPEEMVKLEQLDVEKLEIALKNTENAREMQKQAMQSDDPWVRRFVYLFAWFWAITSVLYFFMVTFFEVPKTGEAFANFILGFLTGTAVATIIGFFYGGAVKEDKK